MQVANYVGARLSGVSAVAPGSPVKLILVGPRETVNRTIRQFHALHFADPNDWSPLQPAQNPGEFITILIKRV